MKSTDQTKIITQDITLVQVFKAANVRAWQENASHVVETKDEIWLPEMH